MRAIIEFHGSAAKTYPKIQTLIVKGHDDLTIRITGKSRSFELIDKTFILNA
jgi:hypothetical protein